MGLGRKMHDRFLSHSTTKDSGQPSKTSGPIFTDVSFEDMAQITLDSIGDAVLVVDLQGRVTYLNKVAEDLIGWSSEKAQGEPVEEVFHIIDGASRQRGESPSRQAIREDRIVELALGSILICQDGTSMAIEDSAAPIHNSLGKVAGAVIVFHDARQSKFEMERMSYLAQYDFLTGLPNRVLLIERLTQATGMANRNHKEVGVLFLDLDHFKDINDAFGHGVGDHLLQAIGTDIQSCVRATDTVSRYGGDEFVVLLPQIENIQNSILVAEKLLTKFAQPRFVGGHELPVTLSIGISVYPENGGDANTLIQNADAAMYTTKENGRNSYKACSTTRDTH